MKENLEQEIEHKIEKLNHLTAEVQKVIIGQEHVVDEMVVAMLARGHALLEGVPGLAKTLMIRTLASCMDLSFKRIQFTPDLMPSDIIGTEVLEEDHSTGHKFFKFNKGPIFSNIVLADEINRTPPKTQAALLQAMQEYEVTYAGNQYQLDKPFFILATQNPIEQAGTFPLPEAQLDRFLLYIQIGYPEEAQEEEILKATTAGNAYEVEQVITGAEFLELQRMVKEVSISDDLVSYVSKITRATRPASTEVEMVKKYVQWGAGPRAGQAMILSAKARALLKGRFSVTPDDIKAVAHPVLRHRVVVNFQSETENIFSDDITTHLLNAFKLSVNGVAYKK